jgi:hypothetical protein
MPLNSHGRHHISTPAGPAASGLRYGQDSRRSAMVPEQTNDEGLDHAG